MWCCKFSKGQICDKIGKNRKTPGVWKWKCSLNADFVWIVITCKPVYKKM